MYSREFEPVDFLKAYGRVLAHVHVIVDDCNIIEYMVVEHARNDLQLQLQLKID